MAQAAAACLLAVLLAAPLAASAVERQAYKYVDEKGNVVYSQTPPVQGKDAKKVDISPASSGRSSYSGGSYEYRQPGRYYPGQSYEDARSRAMQEQQKRREEAEKKRLADLQAECNRNRGADCSNPEVLRQLDAQRIPGGRGYYRPH